MNFKEYSDEILSQGGQIPRPLDLLGAIDGDRVMVHISEKKAAYSGDALSVGIAMDSPACILNNAKAAKEAGATTAEIVETFAVAKFSKGATALSSALSALEWLKEHQ